MIMGGERRIICDFLDAERVHTGIIGRRTINNAGATAAAEIHCNAARRRRRHVLTRSVFFFFSRLHFKPRKTVNHPPACTLTHGLCIENKKNSSLVVNRPIEFGRHETKCK